MIINGNDVAEVVVGSQQANGSDLFPVRMEAISTSGCMCRAAFLK